jgi:hypothetical protein
VDSCPWGRGHLKDYLKDGECTRGIAAKKACKRVGIYRIIIISTKLFQVGLGVHNAVRTVANYYRI